MRPTLDWILLALLALPVPALAKPPTLDRFFPPGAERGQTIEIKAEGNFDAWPVRAWVQGRGVEIRAAEAKGKLTVVVARNAAIGVAWVRLYNEEGASELRPFVVGTLPEVAEVEPNDSPTSAQAIRNLPTTINGRLGKNGDVDGYVVSLQAGQTIVAALQGHEALGSPMDAILQVARPDGIVLEHADDSSGIDPRLVFVAPATGDYVVRTFAFPFEPSGAIRFAGGDAFVYRLTLTTGGFADYTLPLAVPRDRPGWVGVFGWNLADEARTLPVVPVEVGSDRAEADHPSLAVPTLVRLVSHPSLLERTMIPPEAAQAIEPPVSVTGRIGAEGERDVYRFPAEKGRILLIRVGSRSLGFPLDPVLRIVDAGGKVVAESDDASRNNRDPEIRFDPPSSAEYRAEVRDLNGRGGTRYLYRLDVEEAKPDVRISLKDTRFSLGPDKPLQIPIVIDRLNGFDGTLTLSVEGLPENVTTSPAVSAPKGESAKEVTLTLASYRAPAWSGPIQIVSRSSTLTGVRRAEATIDATGSVTNLFWLTVLKPVEPRDASMGDAPRGRH